MPHSRSQGSSPRRSLNDKAYDYLRQAILRGDLPVGTIIAETKVAEGLGISKTPVRQALQLLRTEGLLEVGPRRQLVVRGFSAAHRNEILRIREALEEIAVETACRVIGSPSESPRTESGPLARRRSRRKRLVGSATASKTASTPRIICNQ